MYIGNKSTHVVLDEKTPKEVFTSEKLDISHLHIFGCPVYIHIPKEKRTNIEPSVNKGDFVSYSETSKEFKIYVHGERHFEFSQDVTFHKEATCKRSKDLEYDPELEEDEHPILEDHDDDSSPFDVWRDNPIEHV